MISSTRKSTKLAAGILALGALAAPFGCARSTPPSAQIVADLPVDEAMQHRQWTPTPAVYANGSVVAYSNRELIKMPQNSPHLRWTADTSQFVINAAWMPITLAYIPLFQPVVYHGYQTPPSYTGVPPVQMDSLTMMMVRKGEYSPAPEESAATQP